MKMAVMRALGTIALCTLAGVLLGGLIEALDHAVFLAELFLRHGDVPSGFADFGLIADMVLAGAGAGLMGGSLGGYVGACIGVACGAGFIRDNTALVVVGGIVLAVVIGIAIIVSAGGLGPIIAVSGFAAGAVLGALVIDE